MLYPMPIYDPSLIIFSAKTPQTTTGIMPSLTLPLLVAFATTAKLSWALFWLRPSCEVWGRRRMIEGLLGREVEGAALLQKEYLQNLGKLMSRPRTQT